MVSTKSVMILDFGKATLIECPVTYKLDADEQEEYGMRHWHIEAELRTGKGAKT